MNAASGLWLHTYSGSPDIDALTGEQVSTTNIVLIIAHYLIGPYAENQLPGSGDVESSCRGAGPPTCSATGARSRSPGTVRTSSASSTFTNAKGQAVDLAPGRTWVEIGPRHPKPTHPAASTITR